VPRDPTDAPIPPDYAGWWRIVDTETWPNEDLDMSGTALISFTGDDDALRMHCLLARVTAMATKTGVSFIWSGASEYD